MNSVETNISVIIPSRIYDENLSHCLKQIRKFYKKIKIILILDSQNKKNTDKNIKILISGNKTIGHKRNLGVKKTKTKFICFIDSDAYPDTPWLNKVNELFKKYKNLGAIGGPNLSPKTKNIEKILVSRSRKLSFVTLNKLVKNNNSKTDYINFLPSCNMILKTNLYKKLKGMDERLYSGEEISLNYNIKKKDLKLIFCPSICIFHKDRNFKHFARQRFIYGSTGLKLFLRYPCKESLLLLISSFPVIFFLLFPFIFFNEFFFNFYIGGMIFLILFCLLNSIKINYSNNFMKSIKLTIISMFSPGIGLITSLLIKDYIIKKYYTQK